MELERRTSKQERDMEVAKLKVKEIVRHRDYVDTK